METTTLQKDIDLKAPISKVWKAITDHVQFGEWFGCKLAGPFVPRKTVHGKLTYPGFENMDWAVDVVEMNPERLFSFRWHPGADPAADFSKETPTLVEFALHPTAEGTHLTVTETGFKHLPAGRRLEAFRGNEEGWIAQLKNIANYVG